MLFTENEINISPPGGFTMEEIPNKSTAHMNKRSRAGSISGRLRAASDLAEYGFIDISQKGTLKV